MSRNQHNEHHDLRVRIMIIHASMSRRSVVPCCLFHTSRQPLIMSVGRSSARHILHKNHPQPSTFTCVMSREISIKHRKERYALAQMPKKLASDVAAPKTELGNQLTKHRLVTRFAHHAFKRLASSASIHWTIILGSLHIPFRKTLLCDSKFRFAQNVTQALTKRPTLHGISALAPLVTRDFICVHM